MVNVRVVRGLTLVALALTLATTTQALTVDTRAREEIDGQRKLQLDLGVGAVLDTATNAASPATDAASPTTDSVTDAASPATDSATDAATPETNAATPETNSETNAATPATDTPSTPTADAPSSILSPVTNLLTPATDAPAPTEAPSAPTANTPSTPSITDAPAATSPSSVLSPVTNLLTPTPATNAPSAADVPSTPTTTDAPSTPTTDAPSSILSPVTDLLTTAPTANTPPATDAPSTPATDAPVPTSVLTPVTDLLTVAPTVTTAPTPATETPAATSILTPVTDLLTTAPTVTTAPSTTTTPDATTTPATILPDIPTLIPSVTSDTPTTTESPVTLTPSVTLPPSVTVTPITLTPPVTDIPVTTIPSTDIPVTFTPVTDIPVTITPSSEPPVTGTPSTDIPSTETPSTGTPSTESPSTETPSTDKPSPTKEPESSGSSDDTYTESPSPVTKTPDDDSTWSPAPVTSTPSATKSPIAIETNSGSEDEQDASEQKDQTQSDVIMYNASATPITATSGSSDPFAIPEDTSATVKPVVLDISDNDNTASQEAEAYVRGKTATTGGATATNANVIGGRNTYVDTENSDVLSSSAAAFHDFLRYASVAFAGISVALLLFFHFVSLDANLLWVNTAWSPNTWEFMFYVGYLQQMQATSELTVLKTPYFLWDYTDSFAWSNFLIQDSSSSSDESRRLETIVLGGIVSYADRIGISEENILTDSVIGFAVIMGVLLVIFLVLAVMAKRKAERALDESSDLNSYTSGVHRLRSVSIRTLGLCVLVWYFALFPLSMLASFEISMEVQASTVADALVVAIIALVLVCFGVLAVAGRVIMHKTKDELEQFENLATWGSLYCEYTYRSRMFFVVDVVVQITTGILVGTVSGDPTQLIVVMGIQALYLACVFIMSPFADQMVLRITYVLGLLKIVNFSLAFAFLNSNTMSATARTRVAQAFIGINSIVILVWFVRQLVVFSTYIRAWMVRSNDDSRGSNSAVSKFNRQSDTESEMYASQYTARGGLADSRGLNDSVNGGTLSLPKGSSVLSMQPSLGQGSSVQSMTTSYGQTSSVKSMEPSFGSEMQFQQQMNRKYEVGF
ncbi:hypothetical protein PHYBOEH_003683 [Phytophthora boehmeriae]|uniref:TRP C-terminal domain-containing protein n=1 Tax=Phytophthora boehmeriae TaxID=109152 RepID=A0A8T1WN95_9STRA|nr:hypothetical protein PHYBOEH_003683 [Phytophthora boehmeriae]